MKHHGEAVLGSALAVGSFLLAHVSTGVGVATGLTVLGVWVLKLRREWRHRND